MRDSKYDAFIEDDNDDNDIVIGGTPLDTPYYNDGGESGQRLASTGSLAKAGAWIQRNRVAVGVCGGVTCVVLCIGALLVAAGIIALIVTSVVGGGYVCGGLVGGDQCVEVVEFEKGAVSADSAECSRLGVKVMRDYGGNAVDAAIAVTLCLGLVHPFSSGIGGGNVMLIYREPRGGDGDEDDEDDGDDDDDDGFSKRAPVHWINARETAPQAAHKDMYNDNPRNAQVGGLSIAVPGEIAGLYLAWQRFGSGLDWDQLFDDVIEMAEKGVAVNALLAQKLQAHRESILSNEQFKSVFTKDGELLREGDTVKYPKLANTLRLIARDGKDAFYHPDHELARSIVADVADAKGIITGADLDSYTAVLSSDPAHIRYSGLDVYGPRPPFSGGPCVQMMLNLLETYDLSRLGNGFNTVHAMLESSKFGFAHRMVLGDPEYVNTTAGIVADMLDPRYADRLRRGIKPGETSHDPKHYGHENRLTHAPDSHGTTHLNVVDANGMAVALTSTINLEFGSFVMGSRTGIIFNDEMDDFSIPNSSNAFNLPPSPSNFIAPGKRPLSSMSPTIITKNGRFFLAVGASGGSRIISATLHTIVNALHLEPNLGVAIAKSRFHHQLLPDDLWIESARPFGNDWLLQRRVTDLYGNYTFLPHDMHIGYVQGIMVDHERNIRHAVSDWRKRGRADGY